MNAYMNDPLFLVERGQADLHLRRRAVRACGVAAARLLGARPSHGGAHRPGASVAGVKRSGKRLIYIYIYMYIYTYIFRHQVRTTHGLVCTAVEQQRFCWQRFIAE